MAATEQGRQLTVAHRRSQLALRGRVVRQLAEIWGAFDPTDIDGSWLRIEPFVMQSVANGRRISEALAATYYQGFRAAEGVTGAAPQITLSDEWRQRASVSFRITGPITAKALVGLNRPDVAAQAMVSLSGAMSRIVMDAGRDVVIDTVQEDQDALGWFRVTALDPCAFCAMLASRGPVFRTQSSASFRAHDHCACTAEPQFSGASRWPGRGREWQQLWGDVTRETKGIESVRAFRRAYEGR